MSISSLRSIGGDNPNAVIRVIVLATAFLPVRMSNVVAVLFVKLNQTTIHVVERKKGEFRLKLTLDKK